MSQQMPQTLALEQLKRVLREPASKMGFNRIQVGIPRFELDVSDIRDLKIRAVNAMKLAIQADGKSPAGFDVTPIIASFLGLPEDWSFTVNAGENTIIDKTIPESTYIVIYAVMVLDAEEITERVDIFNGSNKLAVVPLHEAYVDNSVPPILYITMPIVYTPNDTMRVNVYSKTSGSTRVVLVGYMATEAGKVLSSGS